MSYLHLTRTRERERSPDFDTLFSRPLARRSSKHQRIVTLSDDEEDCHDDYPYSSNHKPARLSRSLTIRNQPSQLERYNIWSDKHDKRSDEEDEEKRSYERTRTYKHRHNHSDDESSLDANEREFRLKVQASFSKPTLPHHHHHHHDLTHLWPTNPFGSSREKWIDEDWETRERSRSRERRRDSVWGSEEERDEEKESWSRYRRIKRTKTEEFRPLSGWRRERIIYGC